ncbi:unnamed protein product [Larinioides sclopetarius]|uniref:Uncharacterized protein n=1 Tax=Larinioides sclopetarius TaxID=280406 RepID=A0AAV2BVA9_9ARAC
MSQRAFLHFRPGEESVTSHPNHRTCSHQTGQNRLWVRGESSSGPNRWATVGSSGCCERPPGNGEGDRLSPQ